jgi:hypothetical protein
MWEDPKRRFAMTCTNQQLHPKRCETCKDYPASYHQCEEISRDVNHAAAVYFITSRKGCASHSTIPGYIITEEQRHKIYKIAYRDHDIGIEIHRILDEIRSNPLPPLASEPEPELKTDETGCLCINCKIEPGQIYCHEYRKRIDRATSEAIDKVLDELDGCIEHDMAKTSKGFHLHGGQDSERYEHIRIENHIRHKIESLRKQKGSTS